MIAVQSIEALLAPLLEQQGFELIETQYRRESGGWILRLFIDALVAKPVKGRNPSVTLDDCQRASRCVEEALDATDLIKETYTLEVSSPGINRPLRKAEHFRRFSGQKAKISVTAPVREGSVQKNFTGVIVRATDQSVELEDVVSGNVEIPISAISKAHLDLI